MSSNVVSLANQFFPEVVKDILKDYPSVRDEVAAYMDAPVFDASYRPLEVNLYFDDCWVASWSREGQVAQILNLQLPFTSRPEVVELEVDGEPGLILVLGVEVLNRIEKIPGHELWLLEKQQAA